MEFHNLYISPGVIRVDKIKDVTSGWTRSLYGRNKERVQSFGRETCWRAVIWKKKRKWKDNIKTYLKTL
jgi:hypothetical protein